MPPLLTEDIDFVVSALESTWSRLTGQRIFITGGTGFFGTWLIETLLEANRRLGLGLSLTVLSRDPDGFLSRLPHLRYVPSLRWVRGSIRELSSERVSSELREESCFDALIHLVTEANLAAMEREPLAGIELIAEGTRRALEFAAAAGVKRFLFTSSGAVYGPQPSDLACIPETYAGAPDVMDTTSAYAAAGNAKRQAELYCAAYTKQKRTEAVVARCFSFVGPHLPLDNKFAVGNFLADARAGRDLLIRGDGTPIRSYFYAAELCVWLIALLERGQPGRAYNVGSAHAVTIRELAERVIRVSGKSLQAKVLKQPDELRRVDRYVPDVTRIGEELGLRERISLESALDRTWRWLQG